MMCGVIFIIIINNILLKWSEFQIFVNAIFHRGLEYENLQQMINIILEKWMQFFFF